jgi:hypothetical protein
MMVIDKHDKQKIPRDNPYAQAIRLLVRGYQNAALEDGSVSAPPSRNDIKRLLREVDDRHREVLEKIAPCRQGVSQEDLETDLGLDAQHLRGRNVGLSRICARLGIEYPIRQSGYTRENRRFFLDPDVAKTVLAVKHTG